MQTLEGLEYTPFIPKALLSIAQEIDKANGASYLVGGWVRDALLAEECRDFDVEVYGLDQDVLLKILSQYGRPNLVGRAVGVIQMAHKGISLDLFCSNAYPFEFSRSRLSSRFHHQRDGNETSRSSS